MTPSKTKKWELDLGAKVRKKDVLFKVWAPRAEHVDMELLPEGRRLTLRKSERGYFSLRVPGARPGLFYQYFLDEEGPFPDPCSRRQPQGPRGPSEIIDPGKFQWTDAHWRGLTLEGQVFYEIHVGTFTREGNFDGVRRQLKKLRASGITVLELMPLADFPGRWNWGYDGVNYYAPCHHYGTPEDLRRIVNEAHALGLGIILDVVYNHFGPDLNTLMRFSGHYCSSKHVSEWGACPNFDGPHSREVREFFIKNVCYWVSEFHMDGFRFDATHSIYDDSPVHFLAEAAARARKAAGRRRLLLIAENECQNTVLIRSPEKGGFGFDALWSDDFHHAVHVALTGKGEAYMSEYSGSAQELLSCVKRGFLFQGQFSDWQKSRRGTPAENYSAASFVFYLQNHDQVANDCLGRRINALTTRARYRALTALLLLGPMTPLLFMGQEYASRRRFMYFSDHRPGLAKQISRGRKHFMDQFPSCKMGAIRGKIPNASQAETFSACKLDPAERKTNLPWDRFHRDLLRLRMTDPLICRQSRDRLDGAVFNKRCFVLRFFQDSKEKSERLLIVNWGSKFHAPCSEPLLAEPPGKRWKLIWSSSDRRYGGSPGLSARKAGGSGRMKSFKFWQIPADTALFFSSAR